MAEEILVSVRIDKPKNQDELTRLTGQIIAQKNEIKQLENAIKTLNKAEGDNTALIKAATKNLEVQKQALSQNVATQKAMISVLNAEETSIKSLNVQNRELKKQRDLLGTSTEAERKKIAEINAQIDKNTATIKANSSAQEKQTFNIGNYASALDGIVPGFSSFTTGIQNATKAGIAFIATPLGAVLAAVGLALIPVIKFLRETGEGQDLLARETAKVNAVLAIFNRYVIELGKALLGLDSTLNDSKIVGFFEKVVAYTPNIVTLTKALYNLIPEETRKDLEEAARLAGELADALDEVKDAEENFGIQAAKDENVVKRLLLQAKNRTDSEQDRIDLLQKALQIEGQAVATRIGFAQEELSILVEKNRALLAGAGIVQEVGDTQEDFVEKNINSIRDFNEELAKSLIDATVKLEEARGSGIAIEEKANNLIDKLEEDKIKKAEQRRQDLEKQAEEDYKLRRELFEAEALEAQARAEAEEEKRQEGIELNQRFLTKLGDDYETFKAREKAADDKALKEKEKYAKRVAALKASEAAAAADLSASLSSLAAKDTIAQKGFALTTIAINSGIGVSNAVKAGSGIPWPGNLAAILSGIAAVLTGIGQAKNLLGFFGGGLIPGFATGGSISGRKITASHGKKISRSNGDDRLITAKVGETVVNERQKHLLGGDAAFAAAGIPGYATGGSIGGSETRIAANNAESAFSVNELAGLINNIRTVLVLEDFQAKQAEVSTITNRARIIG